uniref:Uncharacterized protein n=1 Tax=Oncorhynchus tshawytscha TaxID=74940 RepID=A0A8C8F031_ONCTS
MVRVWRYLSWRPDGDSAITRDASFRARDIWWGSFTSLSPHRSTLIPHGQ